MKSCGFVKNLTIFDVGAHKGQTSLHLHKVFKYSTIYSFEPSSILFEMLSKKLVVYDKIYPHNFGFGEFKTSAYLHQNGSDLCGQVQFHSNDSQIERISLDTINNFCFSNNINQIDILKIDTEGYEMSVLSGASELIDSCSIKAIYLECDFNKNDLQHTFFQDIFCYLTERSFAFHGLFDVVHYSRSYGIGYCNALFLNRNII